MDVEPRRSLRDLYKTKAPVQFPDPEGGPDAPPVRVWVAKLNKSQMEAVERRAGAAKALVLMDRDNPESDEILAHMAELMVLEDPNQAIPFITVDKVRERRLSITAQHSTEGKWGENDLHDALVDLWKGDGSTSDTLESIWASYPEEPKETVETPDLVPRWHDAQKVFEQLRDFQDEVNEILEGELEEIEAQYRIEPDEFGNFDPQASYRLLMKAAKVFVEEKALAVYWEEFARQRAFYSTRQRHTEPDADGHEVAGPEFRKPYFGTLEDYDDCDDTIKDLLRVTYDQLSVPGLAGKESPAATPSSSLSDSPELAEASASSGPEESTT